MPEQQVKKVRRSVVGGYFVGSFPPEAGSWWNCRYRRYFDCVPSGYGKDSSSGSILSTSSHFQRQTTGPAKYKGPLDCFKTICKEEGAAGLYR